MTIEAARPIYGLMAEFITEHDIMRAALRARAAGFTKMDAYTPLSVTGLDDALGLPPSRVPLLVLCGGLTGVTTAFVLEFWTMAKAYPINVGGRPLNSWPMWVPVMFELTVLFSSFAAMFGMLALNRLPMPYHPVFNAPGFERASVDRFFLCIEATDPLFDRVATRNFLESLEPNEVSDVEE